MAPSISFLKKIVLFIPNKIIKINSALEKALGLPEKAEKGFVMGTKVLGAGTGAAQAGKGSADLAEAIVCQDGVCAVVSGIGLAADCLQICGSFVPGPNVTVAITVPVSYFCKTFVWACKRSKLPFGGC
jgi:hypothetical protein